MTDETPQIGTRLGPYVLNRLIGSGGMGQVFEATDTVMDRVVALKLISSSYAQDPDYRKRLQREARIAGRLQDPHIVPIHGAGEIDGQLYVDMRLINGTDLDSLLKRGGPLSPPRAVGVIQKVAAALDAAHAAGVMHRDVKPANILVTSDDFAYLVDFGIANAATEERLTQMGDVLGTWAYMAPERFVGNVDVTPRADVYALTCVLFEALTGVPPFGGDRTSVIAAHLSQPIPRASTRSRAPSALDGVIARGMAKDPAHRYATAGELARAATAALSQTAGRSGSAAPYNFSAPVTNVPTRQKDSFGQSPTYPPPPPGHGQWPAQQPWQPGPTPPVPVARRRRRWIPAAIAAVLVVAVVTAVGVWQFTGRQDSDDQADDTVIDVSTLDVGDYDPQPRDLSAPVTEEEGRVLESFRLAEGIPNPYDFDQNHGFVYGVPASDTAYAATAISGTMTPLTQPVMDKYEMISAYLVIAYPVPITEFLETKETDPFMTILLASYPNPDAAARAATEIEEIDFDVNPNNERIDIPDFDQAIAHYQPGNMTIGATVPYQNFVVSIILGGSNFRNPSALADRVSEVLDAQIPLLDKIFPNALAAVKMLPRDPDDVLRRAFVVRQPDNVGAEYNAVGGEASLIVCASDAKNRRDLLRDAGVDQCAVTADSMLIRARDDATAVELLPDLLEAERNADFVEEEIAGPEGVPDAVCFEQTEDTWADNEALHYFCYVAFGRYVASVYGPTETDVWQRASAAYAMLVNSD